MSAKEQKKWLDRYHKGEGLLDEYVKIAEKTKVRKRGQVSRLEASLDHRAKRRKRKARSTQLLLGSYNSELNITNRTGEARTQHRGHSTKRLRQSHGAAVCFKALENHEQRMNSAESLGSKNLPVLAHQH